jgi:hypothetical protein
MDEPLPANYDGRELHRRVDVATRFRRTTRAVAVEARVPAGAVVRYGLLGAHLLPTDGAALQIGISVASEAIVFETSLAISPEQVLLGLTESYAESIADVFVAQAPTLGCGSVHVRWGAHGQIGSSRAFFQALAHVVVDLLASGDSSEETVRACLSEGLSLRKL